MTTQNLDRHALEISAKKRCLYQLISTPVDIISRESSHLINNVDVLDHYLQQAIVRLPHCSLIYVTDRSYCQISSNIRLGTTDPEFRGQDLSQRPYLQATIPLKGLVLSDSYIDSYTSKTCITVVQAIEEQGDFLGLLIADFNLDALPIPNDVTRMMNNWQQFKGDPAIRGSLFSQQRIDSYLDTHILKVHEVVMVLMLNYGVFHFKLHYSSSRISLWLYDQPHHYRLHNIADLLDATVFSCYPERTYPEDTCVDGQALNKVLKQFMALRFVDENMYLRSASVNIINGMVGLNFSCDGSHYMPVDEFIENTMDYWLGAVKTA